MPGTTIELLGPACGVCFPAPKQMPRELQRARVRAPSTSGDGVVVVVVEESHASLVLKAA